MGDYIEDFPIGQYEVVTMIYCDMGTHSDSARDRLLENIYCSLADGRVFIFDVFSEEIINDKQESKSWEYMPSGGFWSESEYLLLSQTFHYPENDVFVYQYNLILEGTTKQFIIWERYYAEKEITDILKRAGFSKVFICGDLFSENDFTSNSELFIVTQK